MSNNVVVVELLSKREDCIAGNISLNVVVAVAVAVSDIQASLVSINKKIK